MSVNNKISSNSSKLESIKVEKELFDHTINNEIMNGNNNQRLDSAVPVNSFQIRSSIEDFETNKLKNFSHTSGTANRKNMINFLEDSLRYL